MNQKDKELIKALADFALMDNYINRVFLGISNIGITQEEHDLLYDFLDSDKMRVKNIGARAQWGFNKNAEERIYLSPLVISELHRPHSRFRAMSSIMHEIGHAMAWRRDPGSFAGHYYNPDGPGAGSRYWKSTPYYIPGKYDGPDARWNQETDAYYLNDWRWEQLLSITRTGGW